MAELARVDVANGVYWVEAPRADLYVLCGAPADSVKHLMKRGLIAPREANGVHFETGPNAILLSDVLVQNGSFSNLAEFPVLHMLYRQGMLLPNHPNNTGAKPLLIGSREQVRSQLEYIYRGNYGLVSEEELMACGISAAEARRMMQLKLAFAFGRIRPSHELVDTVVVGSDPVELRNGVFLRRRALNVFEFLYRGESLTVDLNLQPYQQYEAPYPLGHYRVDRGYFSIVHSGEGDGWDPNRPAMASVLIFQGKPYLIDAGPNILHSIKSLGIGITEVEGIFQTHAHDDHFCGLPTLMRSDRRIRYFATPMVRASVEKKLAALLGMDESHFQDFFEPHDLKQEAWNEVDGLEVRPCHSPHPVETTVFVFRALGPSGYATYAHLADIVDLQGLEQAVQRAGMANGAAVVERARRLYSIKVDLKKVDVGGGLIHGNARDFRGDASGKLVLSHTSFELTPELKEIGCGSTFGAVDELIPACQDYVRDRARHCLASYYPGVPAHEIEMLLNAPIVTFNAESFLMRADEPCRDVYLVLTGEVELLRGGDRGRRTLSAGGLLGEGAAILRKPVAHTYRATSFVQALRIPANVYLAFVQRNGLLPRIADVRERREFLDRTWLFGDSIAYPTQVTLAREMVPHCLIPGHPTSLNGDPAVCLIREGEVQLLLGENVLETLGPGEFYGESTVLHGTPGFFTIRATMPTELYRIPGGVLRHNPVVRWKLLEVYERRMQHILNPTLVAGPVFRWRPEYSTGISEIDEGHQQLFDAANRFHQSVAAGEGAQVLPWILSFLEEFARMHFAREEELLREHAYPGYARHHRLHERLLEALEEWKQVFRESAATPYHELVQFFSNWILEHILTEDHKYGRYLNERGVT
ncbi:MAG TPA: bacteriohemerythrin [Armatimonadota bacterium]|nr:bacteriohemerythrin [Armatimonadota bacterium]HPO71553.1 bacteriohemerythrin [Armatimonadota bacterium]HPT96325.1 bacteriohemerythrin [Armatimonadota bacterium]